MKIVSAFAALFVVGCGNKLAPPQDIPLTRPPEVVEVESGDIEAGSLSHLGPVVEEKVAAEIEPKRIPLQSDQTTRNGILIRYVAFDSRDYELKIVDQKDGPGSEFRSSLDVLQKKGALAVINGGFFTPEGKPLGVVMTEGERRGGNNSSSLGVGYFRATQKSMKLVRRESFRPKGVREALQAGPFLVWNGATPKGLSKTKTATRSLIATDGKFGWVIATTGNCSLADLGSAIRNVNLGEVAVQTALNFDGGRSCDFAIASQCGNFHGHFRGFFAADARNYVVLSAR